MFRNPYKFELFAEMVIKDLLWSECETEEPAITLLQTWSLHKNKLQKRFVRRNSTHFKGNIKKITVLV